MGDSIGDPMQKSFFSIGDQLEYHQGGATAAPRDQRKSVPETKAGSR